MCKYFLIFFIFIVHCDDSRRIIARHSLYETQACINTAKCGTSCKSEMKIASKQLDLASLCQRLHDHNGSTSIADYYKKYEHDEVPVKDSHECSGVGEKNSITNSELDKLEMKIFKNMSREIEIGDNSAVSLESNIKLFKTTVQEIFDKFYANMRDFEHYKERFNEILAKNQEEAVGYMEDFIKDMINHIMTSDSSLTSESKKIRDHSMLGTFDKDSITVQSSVNTNTTFENFRTVIESYKNDHYFTDSTLDEGKARSASTKEEIFNIYLSGTPYVQIKMNDRNLLSEINITDSTDKTEDGKYVASAENMKRLAEKKIQLERYVHQEQERHIPDREIPVKVSNAKKNIFLNEDFAQERETEKSFIFKICNFLCKKFRRSP